jgi:hypothetical protein
MRRIVGRYGLTGKQQVCPIRQLSDGQRCRVVFAWLVISLLVIILIIKIQIAFSFRLVGVASTASSFVGRTY